MKYCQNIYIRVEHKLENESKIAFVIRTRATNEGTEYSCI